MSGSCYITRHLGGDERAILFRSLQPDCAEISMLSALSNRTR